MTDVAASVAIGPSYKSGHFAFISAAGFWCGLDRCVGEQSENVAGRWLSVLCPLCGPLCHVDPRRRDVLWQHYHDVQLPYCVRLVPFNFSNLGVQSSDNKRLSYDLNDLIQITR